MRKIYVKIDPEEKLKLLQEHSAGVCWSTLDDEKWCLHCRAEFSGHAVRVYRDDGPGLWLECGTPNCDGSPIDWADYPWWDEDHPLTKVHEKLFGEAWGGEDSDENPERN